MNKLIFLFLTITLNILPNVHICAQNKFSIGIDGYIRTERYEVTDNGGSIGYKAGGAVLYGLRASWQTNRLKLMTGIYSTAYNSIGIAVKGLTSSSPSRLIVENNIVVPLMISYDLFKLTTAGGRQHALSAFAGINISRQQFATASHQGGVPSQMYALSSPRDTLFLIKSRFFYESKYILLPLLGASLTIAIKKRLAVIGSINYTFDNIASGQPIIRSQTQYSLYPGAPTHQATIRNYGRSTNIGLCLVYIFE